jgi:hypothetical protein
MEASWTGPIPKTFRNAHKNAGNNKAMYAAPPNFEGFEAVLDA